MSSYNPEEKFDRIKYYLNKSDSDELILLKGHLLIEEHLDTLIVSVLGDQIASKLNLNFERKLYLFCGLTKLKHTSDIFILIKRVNSIRNKFAHNLELVLKSELIDFIRIAQDGHLPKTINRKSTYLNSLRRSFFYILGYLLGVSQVTQTMKDDDGF